MKNRKHTLFLRSNRELYEIKRLYEDRKDEIVKRIEEFKDILKKDEKRVFLELIFCLLTPQSKAKRCWEASNRVVAEDPNLEADPKSISTKLRGIRFREKKAKYIKEAKETFIKDGEFCIKKRMCSFRDSKEAREWLVQNIKGMGYKEASHFLRNIGMGENLAILDRHILKNLKKIGLIKEIPKNLSKNRYFEIEKIFEIFAKEIEIPMDHLDLVLWCKETGEVFK